LHLQGLRFSGAGHKHKNYLKMKNNYQRYVFDKKFERTKEFKYHYFEKVKHSLKLGVYHRLKIN
jgi:hypothetical protein